MGRFDEIIPLVRQGSVSLFIGAGFSLKAGAPKVVSLKRALVRTLPSGYKKGLTNMPLDDVAQEVVKFYRGNRSVLFSVLKRKLAFPRKDMSDHIALAMIPHFRRLFTTNYDTLLEEAYGEDRVNVVRCNEECANPEKEVNLYKIHGDLQHPEQLVITRDDYDDTISTDKNQLIWNKVYDAFASTDVVFMGYSLEDTNVQRVLGKVFKYVGDNRRKVFLIAPGFSDVKIDELRRQGVVYVDALAEEFLQVMTSALKDHVYKDLMNGIVAQDVALRFFELYHLSAVIENHDGKVSIKSITPTDSSLPQVMHLSIPVEGPGKNPFDFEKQGERRKELKGPSICYEGEKLRDFEFRINGVKVMGLGEIGKVMFGTPALEEGMIDIFVPEIGFLENVPYRLYQSDNRRVLSIDTALCETEFSCEDGQREAMIKVFYKDDYGRFDQAVLWTNFFIAVFEGKEVVVRDHLSLRLNPDMYDGYTDQFRNTLLYYSNVRKIELLRGKTFGRHAKYDDDAVELSTVILNMLSGEVIKEPLNPDGRIEVVINPESEADFLAIITPAEYNGIQESLTSESDLILNGENFGRVRVLKTLQKAHIERVYQKDGNTMISIAPDVDHWVVTYVPANGDDTNASKEETHSPCSE